MEARELRTGNLIYGNVKGAERHQNTIRVEPTTMMMIDGTIKNEALVFEPIPLTEEWLLKFGFEKKSYKNKYPKDRFIISDIDLYYTKQESFEGYVLSYDKTIIRGINYVYQLQNLYFALTGEELTLKD